MRGINRPEHSDVLWGGLRDEPKERLRGKLRIVHITVEPKFSEGTRDWPNTFSKTRFRYIEALFHMFYYNLAENIVVIPRTSLYSDSLYRGSTVVLYLRLRRVSVSNYRKIPKISPSKYKLPKPVTQKTLR